MEDAAPIAHAVVWIVFVAALLLSLGMGAVLAYHWFRFSMNHVASLLALAVYTGGCVLLLMFLFGSALSFP